MTDQMDEGLDQARLLPWSGPEGRPCYVLADDRGGRVSRLADQVEALQLGMGNELIGHAEALLGEVGVDARELRFLSTRLVEALRDALRIAESRGDRLRGRAEGALSSPYER